MQEIQTASATRPDRGRSRYWTQLIKLLRAPWPPRSNAQARTPDPSRSPEPTRQPAPARLDDE
jgi:hypothetical protein